MNRCLNTCVQAVCLGAFFFSCVATAAAAELSQLHWRSIGPAVPGGRIAAVAGSDADPYVYYMGAADGGVFRTSNGGASWNAIFSSEPVASIGALAVANRDPNDVWAGTGEANPRNDVSYGDGVWRSRDGGQHWTHAGLAGTSQISRILIDPRDPNVALVGALGDPFKDSSERGVYRTTDGGKTWRKTLYAGASSGIADLAWDPLHPGTVFAAVWQYRRLPWDIRSGGPGSGLYRSNDGGIRWRRLHGNGLPPGLLGRIGVAVAPGHPNRVYAVIQSKSGYVWRSDDGGDHWLPTGADSLVNERPFYFSHLFVDPKNKDHVYALSVHLSQSQDGARTFRSIDNGEMVDHHAMWISSDGRRILEGNDNGASLSVDHGKTWDWRANVAVSQVYHLGYDLQNPYNVCAGFQDAETFCGPSNSLIPEGILNRNWLALNDADGTSVWPDPLDPHLIWNAIEIGYLNIFNTETKQATEISPYPHDLNALGTIGQPYRFSWEAPIAFSVQDPHVMYFGGNVLFSTADRGQHWQVRSPDLTRNEARHQHTAGGPITVDGSGAEYYDTIVSIGASPAAADQLWVGTDDGLIQLTRDGGRTWRDVSVRGLPPYGRVNAVEPSHTEPAVAYAAIDRHLLGDRRPYLFKTDDYGRTWRSIVAGLPLDDFVRVVREDPRNPAVLYAGLEQGIWVSIDGGASWLSLQSDLPTSSVRDLQVQPQANDLIAGTHGRSLWILDDLAPLQALARARATGLYLFTPRTAYAYSQWHDEQAGYDTRPPLGNFAGENPPYGALVSYYVRTPRKSDVTAEIADSTGRIVRHLNADDGLTNMRGINRFAWDLTEDPPVAWHSAPKWNQGPADGPEAVPGRYSVRLQIAGRTLTSSFLVEPDPRAAWSISQYVLRRNFLARLADEFSQVDVALNRLDSLRRAVAQRSRALARRGAADDARSALARAAREAARIEATLTSSPRNDQDDDFLSDRLRERIQFAIGLVSLPLASGLGYGGPYLGPPLPPHEREAAQVHALFARRMSDYRDFMETEIPSLNQTLTRRGLQPL